MEGDAEFVQSSRRLLREIVSLLAADVSSQVEWLDGMSVDEFGLDFDLYWHPTRRDLLGLSAEAQSLLNRIGRQLDEADSTLWSRDALRDDARWVEIRRLAAEALPQLPTS
jgi:hypothetical protein